MLNAVKQKLITNPTHIAPLAVFRIAFGGIMLVSTLRFILKGWVSTLYIKPAFHFTFYGFSWVKYPGATGMYLLFAALIITTTLITVGLFYRAAIVAFFLCFTYVELIDKTTYLNHYYFVSVIAFLLVWVPANRFFAVDIFFNPKLQVTQVPAWVINIFKLQLVLVYFFAGISKINYDWLIAAMPLKIWLPANSHLPLIGGLLTKEWIACLFSWFGCVFDLVIGFLLLNGKTRTYAYVLVIIFHLATGWFFKIGMFPYIMIVTTLIFFSAEVQLKIIAFLKRILFIPEVAESTKPAFTQYFISNFKSKIIYSILLVHFAIQLLFPFRYLLYPGKLYWTEEGYRFSWRVMLMEKGGTIFFHVQDPATGRRTEVDNSRYLTPFQENMMATQPDMILQYAHLLAREYQNDGIKNPVVTAESYVTLNGSGSRLYIDSSVNLAAEQETWTHKKWILPFSDKQ